MSLGRREFISGAATAGALTAARPALALEQRNEVSFERGPYNLAFYHRHNLAYRIGAGMHFFHSKQHDLLQKTRLEDHESVDSRFEKEARGYLLMPPRTEPQMQYYSEFIDRAAQTVFRAIDWTHMHHEQTYDIMADAKIAWPDKKRWTDRSVHYYLTTQTPGLARSCAPLDVTMRRAAVMMKPYFRYFTNYYPKDQGLFYVAHWWHPAVYEAQMLAGNGSQEATIKSVTGLMYGTVLSDYPQRMVLSREIMPRYSRMSPESANIFDNLHMLHGIVYDILAYPTWSMDEKRAELYRVIAAMSYQPGDEALARKFSEPYPDFDPRAYPEWVKSPEGEMGRIMMEMMTEMAPIMGMPSQMSPQIMAMFRAKMNLGFSPGEPEGSLHDMMMKMMPGMMMMPGALEPGRTPTMMVDAMLASWRTKYGAMPDIAPLDMSVEPPFSPAVAA